ncbi:hypothetical protein [Sorangium sp. So ce693]|uniref:hypothetical protein n=1 Tax=Sorangium sp. So ce693 TaxID=3133318 RepID=UPI003F5FCA07
MNDTAAEHGALTLADQEHHLLVTTELDAQVVLELQGAPGALEARVRGMRFMNTGP